MFAPLHGRGYSGSARLAVGATLVLLALAGCEGNPQVWFDVMCGMLVLRPRVLLARMVLRCVCVCVCVCARNARGHSRTRTRTHVRAHILLCLPFWRSLFLARVPARLRARASFLPLPLSRERARSLLPCSLHTRKCVYKCRCLPREALGVTSLVSVARRMMPHWFPIHPHR